MNSPDVFTEFSWLAEEFLKLLRQISPERRLQVLRYLQSELIKETGGPQLPVWIHQPKATQQTEGEQL